MTVSHGGQPLKRVPADSSSPAICPVAPTHTVPRLLRRHRLQRPTFPPRPARLHARGLRLGRRRQPVPWASAHASTPSLRRPPPRRRPLNGHVERANRTERIEFWNQYAGDMTVADANARFDGYLDYYNNHRPHSVIGMATGLSRDTFSVLHTVSNLPRSPCLRTGTPPPHFSVLATRRSLSCQLDNISQRIGVSGTGPPREPAGWPRVAQRACASLRVRDDRGVCRKENGCGFSFALVGDGRRRCRTFFGCIGHLDGTGQGRARGRVGCGQRGEPG